MCGGGGGGGNPLCHSAVLAMMLLLFCEMNSLIKPVFPIKVVIIKLFNNHTQETTYTFVNLNQCQKISVCLSQF